MILMYTTLGMPLLARMIRSFFIDLPREIEEAALVDGCSRWQALRLVMVPALSQGVFAACTLALIAVWNEFMFTPYHTGKVTRTIPVKIYNSLGCYQLDWAKLSTYAVIAITTAILFAAFTQMNMVSRPHHGRGER
jgi:multiple sugar transport system permease protein